MFHPEICILSPSRLLHLLPMPSSAFQVKFVKHFTVQRDKNEETILRVFILAPLNWNFMTEENSTKEIRKEMSGKMNFQ